MPTPEKGKPEPGMGTHAEVLLEALHAQRRGALALRKAIGGNGGPTIRLNARDRIVDLLDAGLAAEIAVRAWIHFEEEKKDD